MTAQEKRAVAPKEICAEIGDVIEEWSEEFEIDMLLSEEYELAMRIYAILPSLFRAWKEGL